MKKYDLIVVGGGIAGIAAAVSAAREGSSVLLIERTGQLGGAMSFSLVYPFMLYFTKDSERRILCGGIFTEMRERFEKYGEKSWEFYKFVFDDMVTETGVQVLFHTTVFEVMSEGRKIVSVSAATKSGVQTFEADNYIDASGDGELMYLAGCDYQLGRETDNLCQPLTTCFRLGNVDIDLFLKEKPALNALYDRLRKEGKLRNPRENILVFTGLGKNVLHLNTTRVIKHDPTDAFSISDAEMEGRRQVYEMFRFLKENSGACRDAELIAVASHIGVRESRKLRGEHVLTADEIKNMTDFEDTIAVGNYEIDIHNPEGTGTTLYYFNGGEYYRIPYRSLLPKEYDNLLVAGRCLSATHEAHSAVRIMPICACLGQAAGVAMAIARKTGTGTHSVDVALIRSRLKELGSVVD
ncbi:MAG: FAD-dependent oxidoreductase [Clostridia bacterium]|nr:FAD-dependent oxidoreductase [Clostridia bacterium]